MKFATRLLDFRFYLNELLRASYPVIFGPVELLKNAPGVFFRKNLASNLARSLLNDSSGYPFSSDQPSFADRDAVVRATQERLAVFARFLLVFVPFTNYPR
jgi:hypothetical protein